MEYKYSDHELELLAKVDELQKEKKWSQKKTAETIGITDGTLSQLRNGKYNANPQKLFDIIKSLLKVVAGKVGAAIKKTRDELWLSIIESLSDGMVLIFDEAQHLPPTTIEVLRSFSDYFADNGQTLGICFVGNPETVDRYSSKRAEFAQIANRTKQKKIYTQEEIKRDDIVKLFPILEAEQKEKEIELLWRVAQTPQALRGAINLFSNAYDNEDYSYEGLIAMMKFMEMQI